MKLLIAVMLAALVCVGTGWWWGTHKSVDIDAESLAFTDDALPKILRNWDFTVFTHYADHEAMNKEAGTTDAQVSEFFDWSRKKLGQMKEYDGAEGQADVIYLNNEAQTVAHYEAEATFQKGDAKIHVRLIKQDGQWKIIGFHVDSPAYNQSK